LLSSNENFLNLIDFGMCIKYVDKDGKHIPETIRKGFFVGSKAYASVHSHFGKGNTLNLHCRTLETRRLGVLLILGHVLLLGVLAMVLNHQSQRLDEY